MRRIANQVSTTEEKVAKKLTQDIQDLNLNLEMVGFYIAHAMPYLHFCRLVEVVEAAKYQREGAILSRKGDYYQHNI
jgi:hypothetical protein